MSIGQRILAARTEAGMSQRELAGESITRNMLSAIEHDKAKPSLDTLIYLSEKLGRSVGYFLGEDRPAVEGYDLLMEAREAYDAGNYRICLDRLEKIPGGAVLGREVSLLKLLARKAMAEQALSEGRMPYARDLLEQAERCADGCDWVPGEVLRQIAILRGRAMGRSTRITPLLARIPEDGALILRARAALGEKRYPDARRYLEAVDERDENWNYLMGEALYGLKDFKNAVQCYHIAERTMAKAVRRRLQLCYAELKDFEKAYRYATME